MNNREIHTFDYSDIRYKLRPALYKCHIVIYGTIKIDFYVHYKRNIKTLTAFIQHKIGNSAYCTVYCDRQYRLRHRKRSQLPFTYCLDFSPYPVSEYTINIDDKLYKCNNWMQYRFKSFEDFILSLPK